MGILKFSDTVRFRLTDSNLIKVQDDYNGAFKPESGRPEHSSGMGYTPQGNKSSSSLPAGLLVRIAATHSGLITRNNGFYLPDKMKKGVSSFTDNYAKPVLLHHNDMKDNIGRIYEAKYRDTSGSIVDRFSDMTVTDRKGKVKGTVTAQLLKDLVDGRMPFGMQVDTVTTLLRDSLLEEPSYEGLGYIELVANITDKEAIQKLLDGRYLTGSVGATTDAAVCSVCRQDWTDAGQCEHRPGGIYDGVKCFIIAGSLNYDEYSFVNVPADRHSKVLELQYNGINDSVKTEDKYFGKLFESVLSFPQYDKENLNMSKKDEVTVQDSVQTESETVINTEEQVSTDTSTAVADSAEQVVEQTEEEPLSSLDKYLSGHPISDEERESLYDSMYEEIVSAVNEGVLLMDKVELTDAKLSTEQRNKLAKSTFCGPDRSFPVPDCAHVVAARRLLSRAKVSSATKDKIDSCVNRKAKAMGCDSKKDAVKAKDSVQEVAVIETQDTVQPVSLVKELTTVLDNKNTAFTAEDNDSLAAVLKLLLEKVGQDSFVQALKVTKVADNLIQEAEQALLDEIAKHEEEIGSLRERLEANRKEYNSLYQDFEVTQDSLVGEKVKTRKAMEAYLNTLKTLSNGKADTYDFSVFSDSALQSEIDQVLKVVDMVKITNKLGDGMSRQPTGEVSSPIELRDNTVSTKQTVDSSVLLQRIRKDYTIIRNTRGVDAAEAFLNKLKQEGKLPQE
jgi:hypothetical protein